MAGLDLSGIARIVEEQIIPWDTVRVTRPSGRRVFDQGSGTYTDPDPETVYEGIGAVQPAGTAAEVVSLPGTNGPWLPETRSKYRLLTPLSAPVAEKDMLVSVVAVHAGGDLELIGRTWRVQDPGGAATLAVLRVTAIDQVQQTREAP
jgi:hypothetical protein